MLFYCCDVGDNLLMVESYNFDRVLHGVDYIQLYFDTPHSHKYMYMQARNIFILNDRLKSPEKLDQL